MKRITSPISYVVLVFTLFSCHKTDVPYTQSGNWVTRSQLDGPARSEAVVFTINDIAYLGTGWDGLQKRYGDFWKLDAAASGGNGSWSQVASLPDSAVRSSAVGFAAGGMGVVSTGYDGANYLKSSYQLDPVANTWTKIADFPGSARYEASGFGLGDNGYVGTGFDGSNALKDFYTYNVPGASWTPVGFSGNKRYSAVTFTYQNKAYIVTGINSGSPVNDFWVFDPASAGWTELRHITNYSSDSYDDGYTNIVRSNAASFVIGDKAYVTCGENGSLYAFTWEYDFATDLWIEKTPLEGPGTTGGVGFNVLNRGFFATGRTGAGQSAQSDFLREFQPTVVVDPNDN